MRSKASDSNKLVLPSKLTVARRNTAALIAFLYLQDIFWLILSRIQSNFYEPIYIVSHWEFVIFAFFITLAVFFATFGLISGHMARPLPRIKLPRWAIVAVIVSAILLNLYSFFVLESNARYISGGLTGQAGVLYGMKNAATMAGFVILIKAKGRWEVSAVWVYTLLLSSAINIDGLASALTLGMFAWLVFDIRINSLRRIALFGVLVGGLLYFGFRMKFADLPDYLTPSFLANWVIGRFSIQAEQMYKYLAGGSLINDQISYLDLLVRMIENRIDLVLGYSIRIEYPRGVSEALFYDMMGFFDAGSSPGVLLGTTLQGPLFSLFVPAFLAFVFVQFFYGIPKKISFLQICAYSFVFKAMHSNFSEYLAIISPTLLTVAAFIFASLIELRDRKRGDSVEISAAASRP